MQFPVAETKNVKGIRIILKTYHTNFNRKHLNGQKYHE